MSLLERLSVDLCFDIAIMCQSYQDYLELGLIIPSLLFDWRLTDARRRLTIHTYEEKGDTHCWTVDGLRHREDDLPAFTNVVGSRWYYMGQLHREGDLPAYIFNNTETWYKRGKRERDGGMPQRVSKVRYSHSAVQFELTRETWYDSNGVRIKQVETRLYL